MYGVPFVTNPPSLQDIFYTTLCKNPHLGTACCKRQQEKKVHSLALTLSPNHLAKKLLWTTSLLYSLMCFSAMISHKCSTSNAIVNQALLHNPLLLYSMWCNFTRPVVGWILGIFVTNSCAIMLKVKLFTQNQEKISLSELYWHHQLHYRYQFPLFMEHLSDFLESPQKILYIAKSHSWE